MPQEGKSAGSNSPSIKVYLTTEVIKLSIATLRSNIVVFFCIHTKHIFLTAFYKNNTKKFHFLITSWWYAVREYYYYSRNKHEFSYDFRKNIIFIRESKNTSLSMGYGGSTCAEN
jgi:hypothetical protein